MKRIKNLEILKNAFILYKNNFSKLIIFSLFITITTFSTSLYTIILNTEEKQQSLMPLMLLMMIFIIFFFILLIKASLAIQIYIVNAKNNANLTIKESFAKIREKSWRYFGNMMLASLFLIPVLGITNYFNSINNPYYFFISIPYTCLIFPLYFLLEPVMALEEKDTLKLKKTIMIIKGNYFRILVLVLVTQIIWTIPNIVAQALLKGNSFAILLIAILNSIILIFTNSFLCVVKGILYQQLTTNK